MTSQWMLSLIAAVALQGDGVLHDDVFHDEVMSDDVLYDDVFQDKVLRNDALNVAVAGNFAIAMQQIAAGFETTTGAQLHISTASTGKLHAQIVNGAPFDVFLAADIRRPRQLEKSGHGVRGSRFTYAMGELALWSRQLDDCSVQAAAGKRLAIANPATAPYGVAAKQYLQNIDAWAMHEAQLVMGASVAQTLHFVVSGNADLGLLARAQLHVASLPQASCTLPVPAELHEPIAQQAILLRRAADNGAAHALLAFLRSAAARKIIVRNGYRLPHDADKIMDKNTGEKEE